MCHVSCFSRTTIEYTFSTFFAPLQNAYQFIWLLFARLIQLRICPVARWWYISFDIATLRRLPVHITLCSHPNECRMRAGNECFLVRVSLDLPAFPHRHSQPLLLFKPKSNLIPRADSRIFLSSSDDSDSALFRIKSGGHTLSAHSSSHRMEHIVFIHPVAPYVSDLDLMQRGAPWWTANAVSTLVEN